MNWGKKIAFLYGGFVIMILLMVALTMREKVDLVSKDYYEDELKYQDRIDMINRTQALTEQLSWKLDETTLTLNFPAEFKSQKIEGSIYFFRPSDISKDKTIPVSDNFSGVQIIPTSLLSKGAYKMKISWKAVGIEYYNEGIIQIK